MTTMPLTAENFERLIAALALDRAGGPVKTLRCRKCCHAIALANRSGVFVENHRRLDTPCVLPCPRCGEERRLHSGR
jgi:hypothetical protein